MTDIFAEMEADAIEAQAIPKDQNLAGVAQLAQNQMDLEDAIAANEAQTKTLKKELREIVEKTLPDAMDELGLSGFALAGGGKVTVAPFNSVSITEARKEEAHTWLENNGHEDLIKHEITAKLGRNPEMTKLVAEFLVGQGVSFNDKEGVHNGTLKVWVREQVEAGTPIPLELFGAYFGQKSTIKRG